MSRKAIASAMLWIVLVLTANEVNTALAAEVSCELMQPGDVDASGQIDITDAVSLLGHLFLDGQAPPCRDVADVNHDARLDISDAVFILLFLFGGGPSPEGPSPCTRGDTDDDEEAPCRGLLLVDGARMVYYTTYSLDAPNPRVTRAVIVVHGGGGNAPGYFRRVGNAAESLGITETTLIAAPHYQEERPSDSGELYWTSGDWREGADGRTSSGRRVSSYRVLDRMVEMLADRRTFPNLKSLVVTGHSAGGQVTQRYAVAAKFSPVVPGLTVRYVPANPSSYVYITAERFIPGQGWTTTGIEFGDCSSWNAWKYGLENRSSVPYLASLSDSTLRTQYRSRSVIYLLGTEDTDPEHDGLDTDCEAMLQGRFRLERGRRIYDHVQRALPGNAHRKVEVQGVEHDGEGMFNSDEGKELLFP